VAGVTRYALLAALVAAWELGARAAGASAYLAPPTEVAALLARLIADGTWLRHAASSTVRVAQGVGAAALVGVAAGVAAAAWRPAGAAAEVLLRGARPVPPVAWIPLSILWFHVGQLQQVFILFIGCVFTVIAGTLDGLRGVDPGLVRAARCLGASRAQVGWRVLLPAAAPQVFAAVREACALGWFILVAAEFVSAPDGLGFLILEGRSLAEPARVLAGMVSVGAVAWGFDAALASIQREALAWRPA